MSTVTLRPRPRSGGPASRAGPTRAPLTQDQSVDVAIVGAGYTGLWTAYYLLEADPSLSVLVLEAEHRRLRRQRTQRRVGLRPVPRGGPGAGS